MAIPIIVNAGEPWPIYEGRCVVEYVDLQGAPAGTGAGEAATYVPKFGRISQWGPRPVVSATPTSAANVSIAITGDGITTPFVITLTAVAALTAGLYAKCPVRFVFNPGSN
jgi:hypothetical protein